MRSGKTLLKRVTGFIIATAFFAVRVRQGNVFRDWAVKKTV